MSEEITKIEVIDEVAVYEKLSKVYPVKETLIELASDYKGLVVTEETFEQAKKARMVLRQPRYDIRNKEKEISSVLNNIKARNKKIADDLIALIQPVENVIDIEIKSIEAMKEAERLERERIKAEQMTAWLNKAQAILTYADTISTVKTLDEAKAILDKVLAIEVTEDEYGAYELVANQNLSITIDLIKSNIESREQAEKERLELEAKQLADARNAYLEYFKKIDDAMTTKELLKAIEDDKTAKLRRLEELEAAEKKRLEEIEAQKKIEERRLIVHNTLVDEYVELFGEQFRGLADVMPDAEIRRIIDEQLAKQYPETINTMTVDGDVCVEYSNTDYEDYIKYNEAIDNVVNHLKNIQQEVNDGAVKIRFEDTVTFLIESKWNV